MTCPAILFDRTGLQVVIPDGSAAEKREAASKVDPWSPAYLTAQAKARAEVDAMTFSEREDAKRAINQRLPRSQKIKMDGGLVRHLTVDILAGLEAP